MFDKRIEFFEEAAQWVESYSIPLPVGSVWGELLDGVAASLRFVGNTDCGGREAAYRTALEFFEDAFRLAVFGCYRDGSR